MSSIIDRHGFRQNVGIIVCNEAGKLLLARRAGTQNAWQFPQGGIQQGEIPLQAMWRELNEELGLQPTDVELLAESKQWLKYYLPKRYQRRGQKPLCVGQSQRWFLLRLKSDASRINLQQVSEPEFDHWEWVDYWFPVSAVIEFKHDVYKKILEEFSGLI